MNFTLDGRTILHLACHEGYRNLVTILLDAGADMGVQDNEGDTPLHFAAFGYTHNIHKFLLFCSILLNATC